jgi:hypothetical protein
MNGIAPVREQKSNPQKNQKVLISHILRTSFLFDLIKLKDDILNKVLLR